MAGKIRASVMAWLVGICLPLMGLVMGGIGCAVSARAETFAEPHFGYRFEIPPGWERVAVNRPFTVMVVPQQSETSGVASVMVINVHRPQGQDPVSAARQAAQSYAQDIENKANKGTILRHVPFRWDMGTAVIMGEQVVASFDNDGVPMRQWAVFLPQPKAEVIHVWQYTASAGTFQGLLPMAQGMLNSLKPVTSEH